MPEGRAEAGAALMLGARREEWLTPAVAALRGRGVRVESAICDVSNPAQVQAVDDRTREAYGKVDILVNNPGASWGAEPAAMSLEKWQIAMVHNRTCAT